MPWTIPSRDRPDLPAGTSARFAVREHRLVLPDTSVELVLVDGRIDVIGPMRRARPSRYPVGTRIALWSIAPADAAEWLGVPLSELTDRVIALDDIDARLARRSGDRLASGVANGPGRPGRAPPRHASFTRAAAASRLLTDDWRVGAVAARLEIGERQLARSFEEVMGLSPKLFARIARLRRAALAVKAGAGLAQAAAGAGYADQAHFNREMRKLAGAPPTQVLPNVGNVHDKSAPTG